MRFAPRSFSERFIRSTGGTPKTSARHRRLSPHHEMCEFPRPHNLHARFENCYKSRKPLYSVPHFLPTGLRGKTMRTCSYFSLCGLRLHTRSNTYFTAILNGSSFPSLHEWAISLVKSTHFRVLHHRTNFRRRGTTMSALRTPI
jgi:hypothetical protein